MVLPGMRRGPGRRRAGAIAELEQPGPFIQSSNWGYGFLPSVYQGIPCWNPGDPVLNLAEPGKTSFASSCLLARRLVERGVRFV